MSSLTTIGLKPETADQLYEQKKRTETWDEFIRRTVLDDE